MKTAFLTLCGAALAASAFSALTVSTSSSDDALGGSIASFESAEFLPRTIVRIAYVDGSYMNGPGTGIRIRDYDADNAMAFLGECSVSIAGTTKRFTQPRISRDGRGITFYATKPTVEPWPNTPYYCLLPDTPYLGSSNTVAGVAAPAAGASAPDVLGDSTSLIMGARARPPAISDYNGGFTIVFEDMLAEAVPPEGEPYAPLMVWTTGGGSGSVDDLNRSSDWGQPAVSSDGDVLAYAFGGQVYRLEAPWPTANPTAVSFFGGSFGNGPSSWPEMDGKGNNIVFKTAATNLRANDANGMVDIYVWVSGVLQLAYNDPGYWLGATCDLPSISPDGGWITFISNHPAFPGGTIGPKVGGPLRVLRVQTGLPNTIALMSYLSGSPTTARAGYNPMICDGGRVAYDTSATDVASGADRAGIDVIYVDQ